MAFGNPYQKKMIIEEIISKDDKINDSLLAMVKDKYGNYVVQKTLEASDLKTKDLIIKKIINSQVLKKKDGFSKHVINFIEKMGFSANELSSQVTGNNLKILTNPMHNQNHNNYGNNFNHNHNQNQNNFNEDRRFNNRNFERNTRGNDGREMKNFNQNNMNQNRYDQSEYHHNSHNIQNNRNQGSFEDFDNRQNFRGGNFRKNWQYIPFLFINNIDNECE